MNSDQKLWESMFRDEFKRIIPEMPECDIEGSMELWIVDGFWVDWTPEDAVQECIHDWFK